MYTRRPDVCAGSGADPAIHARPSPRIVRSITISALLAAGVVLAPAAVGQSLHGSTASLDIQNEMAKAHQFTYLATHAELEKFVRLGYLVPVEPNGDFDLHEVSYPYARPETVLFVKKLAAQYHATCGEPMMVTSLTRPESEQPPNASDRSVHPTGMAVDLRRPVSLKCRKWLETTLLTLENDHVVEATREQHPAHYHVAVFPDPYKRFLEGKSTSVVLAATALKPKPTAAGKSLIRYQVRSGDSLWNIARKHGTTVALLRAKNELPSNEIHAGQVIEVPATH